MVRFAVALTRRKDAEKVVWENGKPIPAISDEQKEKALDVVFVKNILSARNLIRGESDHFAACFTGLCFPLNFIVDFFDRKIGDSRAIYFCKLFLADNYVEIPIDEDTDILIADSSKNIPLCLPFYLI